MINGLQGKTRDGIKVKTEDYSDSGVDKPFRMTASIPISRLGGKQMYKPVQFAFESMTEANNVLFNLQHAGARLRDYTKKLIEPDNERYIRNL